MSEPKNHTLRVNGGVEQRLADIEKRLSEPSR
jgi:hypothetical protein